MRPTMTATPRLPGSVRACLFDLDGVLTRTAAVHAAAWKEMFDDYLRGRDGDGFRPFDLHDDYDAYVDGKPRADGTRSFLQSRGISLPDGDPGDPPDAETVHGLGDRKNDLVQRRIEQDGVETYDGSLRFLHSVRKAGLKTAVVSSSANTLQVLQVTGLVDEFDVRVDGTTAAREHLPGKPAPDTFLAAARRLGLTPGACAVFEDALAGVAAGKAGRFALVVGVDRAQQADQLRAHGADVVVEDLAELLDPA